MIKIFCIIVFSAMTLLALADDYTLKLSVMDGVLAAEDVAPFVLLIGSAGENTMIDSRGAKDDYRHQSGITIKNKSDMFNVAFEVHLPHSIRDECVVWISNSFSADDVGSQIGKSLPSLQAALKKNGTKIMKNTFSQSHRAVLIESPNSESRAIRVSSDNCGLLKLCTIIPYHNRVKWDNEFFPRDQVVTGKVWNTALHKPFEGADIYINNVNVAASNEEGIYFAPYRFGIGTVEVFARFEDNQSSVKRLTGMNDSRPRMINLSLDYQPQPPPPENLREVFYLTFAFDSFVIETNTENLALLKQIEKLLNRHKIIGKIRIEGHTDSIGSRDYNYDLSHKRAEALLQYLCDRGFDKKKFVVRGFGPDNPLKPNDTELGRQKNRRVEIAFQYEVK